MTHTLNRRRFLQSLAASAAAAAMPRLVRAAGTELRPNIIVILADDIGYGDVGCYGATRVPTPYLDRLSEQGVRFSDAHSPAATCTPTRYAMLTGEYAFRQPGTGILSGLAPLCIKPGRPTLPAVLKQAGYATGCVGKWHLGLGTGNVDYNGEIRPGPLEIGFDECFIIPATGDRVPCVFVQDHRVVGLDAADPIRVSYGGKIGDDPTGREKPDLLKMKFSHGHDGTIVNGISRIGYMTGGKAARWKDEDMADTITSKADDFIGRHKDKPFFLYFATHDIHVPRAPNERFHDKSQCGIRGDAIHEFDWSVGQIMETLDRLGLARNTLLVVTSDNGPVLDDGYADGAVKDSEGHAPSGPFRGGKYSPYEGGTRMPFLVRWPARVRPGTSDALVCQVDFLASFAALVGQPLPEEAGPDSFNVLPALLGESKEGRDHLVEQAGVLSIRRGPWKYIPEKNKSKNAAPDADKPSGALYNLADDIGENNNLIAQHPDKARELADLLQRIVEKGRSRP